MEHELKGPIDKIAHSLDEMFSFGITAHANDKQHADLINVLGDINKNLERIAVSLEKIPPDT